MTVSKARAFCAVNPCLIRGSHRRDCLERPGLHECEGCMPGTVMEGGAADGALICYFHHNQAVRALLRLPDLNDAMREAMHPYRSPQAEHQPGGRTAEVPLLISPGVTEARDRLYNQLENMVAFLARERGFRYPRKTVEDFVEFLHGANGENALWLSRHPYEAAIWGERMQEMVRDATRQAYPGRNRGLVLGDCPVTVSLDGVPEPCGTVVRLLLPDDPDEREVYMPTCPSCGTREPVSWWIEQQGKNPPELMAAPKMAIGLSIAFNRPVTASQVRQWAHRKHISAVARAKNGQPLYDREAVEEYARSPRVYNQPKTGASA